MTTQTINIKQKDQALTAIDNRHHALLITGNIFDYQVDPATNALYYRPMFLAEELYKRNYIVFRYSRSAGLTVYRQCDLRDGRAKSVSTILNRYNLAEHAGGRNISPTEVVQVFRSFKRLLSDINSVYRIAVIVDYLPHLVRGEHSTIEERIVAEALNDCATQPNIQKNGNIIVAYTFCEDSLGPLTKRFYRLNYSYPNLEEYRAFYEIVSTRTDEFAACSLDASSFARLARGLSLHDLLGIFKEQKSKGEEVFRNHINEAKERLINHISDKTLTVIPTDVGFDDLAGMQTLKAVLGQSAALLKESAPASPMRILLVGPPGTGKSTVVKALARACEFNLLELSDEIKSKWVGESEARLSTALSLIEALAPVILFIDEIDQSFKSRSESSNDGGVSTHYLKTLFKFAARDELRGKVVIVGASNTPQTLDPAMIDRFQENIIPMLESTPMELAAIFPKIEKRITGRETLDPKDPVLLEASEIIYAKGASPRQLFGIINRAMINSGSEHITSTHILEACKRFRAGGNPVSGAYSSLSAIDLTSCEDFFPWKDAPQHYPYAWYLEGIVNRADGSINETNLRAKINELGPRSGF